MLRSLTIRNVVLIEKLDLAFRGGLGVLTGETGSGKSILLDALGLALGARADTDLISAGADQGSATAEFELEICPCVAYTGNEGSTVMCAKPRAGSRLHLHSFLCC